MYARLVFLAAGKAFFPDFLGKGAIGHASVVFSHSVCFDCFHPQFCGIQVQRPGAWFESFGCAGRRHAGVGVAVDRNPFSHYSSGCIVFAFAAFSSNVEKRKRVTHPRRCQSNSLTMSAARQARIDSCSTDAWHNKRAAYDFQLVRIEVRLFESDCRYVSRKEIFRRVVNSWFVGLPEKSIQMDGNGVLSGLESSNESEPYLFFVAYVMLHPWRK